jgi:hypothetical protein
MTKARLQGFGFATALENTEKYLDERGNMRCRMLLSVFLRSASIAVNDATPVVSAS